ncbi:MAG: efflux RND transporter periplasmic adaptor subunit [Bacteroidetes bacterium]|nr:efflux RND transporter periplasmic adaptor subunit [Bacteroidota bacterium]
MVLFCTSCGGGGKPAAKTQGPVPIDVLVVSITEIEEVVDANGTVLAGETVELHPESSGRLSFLNMPDGGTVSAGAVLARINDAEILGQIAQQQAGLALAMKNESRLKQLLAVNAIPQAEYDAAQTQVLTIQATLQTLQAQAEKLVVKAPFAGQLGLRKVSPGAYVSPATILGTLQQTYPLKVDFALPDVYVSLLEKNSTLSLLSSNGTRTWPAKIIATESRVNAENRNLTVRAAIEGTGLKPGEYVTARFKQKQKGILIPTNALIPEASSNKVIVVKNGTGKPVPVKTGTRGPEYVQITSGLTEGDSVVVTGVLFVRPKSPLKVRSVKTLAELK